MSTMNILDALFAGAKALVSGVSIAGRALIREVLKEVDHSAVGQAAARVLNAVADRIGKVDRIFHQAQTLVEEEQEIVQKATKDGYRDEASTRRLQEIQQERKEHKRNLERTSSEVAAREFQGRADELLVAELDDDELSSNVGILSAKLCPTCGGMMRIQQGRINKASQMRNFYWQCTEQNQWRCPTVKLNTQRVQARVVRPQDSDLDTPKVVRRSTWSRPDVITQTHGRVRQHLGDDDKQIVCPHHLIPMKLLPKRRQSGLVLDNYEYVCLGVMANGMACNHVVDFCTMPQVAAMLRRTEGSGIIQS